MFGESVFKIEISVRASESKFINISGVLTMDTDIGEYFTGYMGYGSGGNSPFEIFANLTSGNLFYENLSRSISSGTYTGYASSTILKAGKRHLLSIGILSGSKQTLDYT